MDLNRLAKALSLSNNDVERKQNENYISEVRMIITF